MPKTAGSPKPEGTAAEPFISWLLGFWTPESEYARHVRRAHFGPFQAARGYPRGQVRVAQGRNPGLQWGDIADGIITVRHNYVDEDGLKGTKTRGGLIRLKTAKRS
jgi:hypothetical protein